MEEKERSTILFRVTMLQCDYDIRVLMQEIIIQDLILEKINFPLLTKLLNNLLN